MKILQILALAFAAMIAASLLMLHPIYYLAEAIVKVAGCK